MAKIHEVAKAAGVSISTVSYALSGKKPVAADTQRRIEAAIRDLDYRPNAGARMLAGRRTNIFALTEPLRADTHAPTHMAFVLATSIAARRYEYDILLLTDAEASAGMRRVASSGLVDAILVLDVAPGDERVDLARRVDVPTIFIGVPDDHEGLMCVDLDFEAAAALAVDHLVEAGHRRLGLVGHPAASYESSNFPPRVRAGFEKRADASGIQHDFRTTSGRGTPNASVRAAVADLLDAGSTGLVLNCGQDAHDAVLAEIAGRGLRVPEDVSLISVASTFDTSALAVEIDAIPLIPQLSCDLAVELAIQSLGLDKPEPGVHLIAPTYDARGSVAAPAVPHAPAA